MLLRRGELWLRGWAFAPSTQRATSRASTQGLHEAGKRRRSTRGGSGQDATRPLTHSVDGTAQVQVHELRWQGRLDIRQVEHAHALSSSGLVHRSSLAYPDKQDMSVLHLTSIELRD